MIIINCIADFCQNIHAQKNLLDRNNSQDGLQAKTIVPVKVIKFLCKALL
jgi:hypothetical protein